MHRHGKLVLTVENIDFICLISVSSLVSLLTHLLIADRVYHVLVDFQPFNGKPVEAKIVGNKQQDY